MAKMTPEEAMKQLGEQLVRTKTGGLAQQVPSSQPLLALFGAKQAQPLPDSTNYLQAAKAAELDQYLPADLPRTPEGEAFVNNNALDNARQLAATHSGSRRLSPEESKLTIEYWREAAPSLVPMAEAILANEGGLPEWLGKAGPSYRLKRSEFASVQGFTEDGQPVEYDATERKWFVGGKETPADQIGRLMSKTRPQLSNEQINEVTSLLNAQTQLNEVKNLFDPTAVGPVQDKLLSFQEFTGVKLPDLHGLSVLTDEKVKLRTILGSSINDYIKAITGAQMSEPEARRIMRVMPKAGSADEAFLPALQEIMKVTDQKLNNRLNVLESQDTVGIKKLRELATNKVDLRTGEPTAPKALPKKKPLSDIFGKK